MNPISSFFVEHIVVVYFFYGLAFFSLGLALALASRRTSELRFAQAIRPLALFGFIHAGHEWVEMFQKMRVLRGGPELILWEEGLRTVVLGLSFLLLLAFGMILLGPRQRAGVKGLAAPLSAMLGLWVAGVLVCWWMLRPPLADLIDMADVLARYGLGVPGALLGTWALMRQQQAFRQHEMPQFGRDLVWAASALFLYGVIGQVFVRETALAPTRVVNSALFLHWFGIPVQLFRGLMAVGMAVFITRALNAFVLENQRRLDKATQALVSAQEAQLATERQNRREVERLNEELRMTAHEMALLLDIANLLVAPLPLHDRLHVVLDKLVQYVNFCDRDLILLVNESSHEAQVAASTGFTEARGMAGALDAVQLGRDCIAAGKALCAHLDQVIVELDPEIHLGSEQCQSHPSPMVMVSLPLHVQEEIIGSIVFARDADLSSKPLSLAEFRLITAAAQQLGLSIENARLGEEAHRREALLGRLLHQVVGAQEAERQRIARELHDASGQSLTAIALGLRGVETVLLQESSKAVPQIQDLSTFSAHALGELRQIISDLRPTHLDDLGLVPALRWYTQTFEARTGVAVSLVVEGEQIRMPSEYETVLFRITQEALTNIAKHAQAQHATVMVRMAPSYVRLIVKDDGRGFEPAAVRRQDLGSAGWGLLGMQERAALLGGSVQIESSPGHGATIEVRVPYSNSVQNRSLGSVRGKAKEVESPHEDPVAAG